MNHTPSLHGPGRFEIRVQGRIDPLWAASFDGLTLADGSSSTTRVTGWFADQSALQIQKPSRAAGLPAVVKIKRAGAFADGSHCAGSW